MSYEQWKKELESEGYRRWKQGIDLSDPNLTTALAPSRGSELNRVVGTALAGSPPADIEQIRKDETTKALTEQGFSPNAISTATRVSEKLRPPIPWGSTIGGIAAPILLNSIPGLKPASVGASALMKFGKPIARTATAMALSALGGGAGEATQEQIDIGKTDWNKVKSEAAINAASELGGRATEGVLAHLFTSPARSGVRALEEAGTFATTGEQVDKLFPQMAEGISKATWSGNKIYSNFAKERNQSIYQMAQENEPASGFIQRKMTEWTGSAPIAPTGIGQELLGAIGRKLPDGKKAFKLQEIDNYFTPKFQELDKMTGLITVSKPITETVTSPIVSESGQPFQREVTKIVKERVGKVGVVTDGIVKEAKKALENYELPGGELAQKTNKQGYDFLKTISELPHKVPFSVWDNNRKLLLLKGRQLDADLDVATGLYTNFTKKFSDALFNPETAQGLTPDGAVFLKQLKGEYGAMKEMVEKVWPEQLAEKLSQHPENWDMFFQSTKGGQGAPTLVKELKQSLVTNIDGESSPRGEAVWNKMTQGWFSQAVVKSVDKTTGAIKVETLQRQLKSMGDDVLGEMYSSSQREDIKTIIDALETANPKSTFGSEIIGRGIQAYAAISIPVDLYQQDKIGLTKDGIMLVGPAAFAALATNRTGARLLSGYIRTEGRVGTSETTAVIAKLIRLHGAIRESEKAQNMPMSNLQNIEPLAGP